MDYQGFWIESFEAGKGLWHARIRRADLKPMVIDGELFPTLEVGFAWSDADAAITDAMVHIDRFNLRRWSVGEMPLGEPPAPAEPGLSRIHASV
jgi:hypothetical protein